MIVHLEELKQFDELVTKGTVLVDFYADWCGPCRMIGPVLEDIAKTETDIVILKVDVDQFGQLAQKYSVFSIPTLLLLKEGVPAGTRVGYVAKQPLLRFIRS